MTTNQNRAAEVISLALADDADVSIDGNYNNIMDVSATTLDGKYDLTAVARALADAGLLAPDLPEPNHADEDGTLEWNIPDPEQPYQGIVRLYPNGNIRLVQINAPIKNPTTALALSRALAAAAYIQTHQEKK